MRLNLTLDDEHAAMLTRLAERTHMQPGTIARSMLLTMLDRTVEQEVSERTPKDIVELLDGIEGAYERTQLARRQAAHGDVTPLDQL